MDFKTKAETSIISKTKYYPKQFHHYQWSVEMTTRDSVGVNLSVVPKNPGKITVQFEDDDGNDHEEVIDLSLFSKIEVGYDSLESNTIGLGLHLNEVMINLDRKEIWFNFNTNSF